MSGPLRRGRRGPSGAEVMVISAEQARLANQPFDASLIDLSGRRFGKVVVLHLAPDRNHRTVKWVVECDCGVRRMMRVLPNQTKSCGCLHKIRREERRQAALARMKPCSNCGGPVSAKIRGGQVRWDRVCGKECRGKRIAKGHEQSLPVARQALIIATAARVRCKRGHPLDLIGKSRRCRVCAAAVVERAARRDRRDYWRARRERERAGRAGNPVA